MSQSKKFCEAVNGLDRISSLPDDVLGHMLSFLSTRCAVKTSILSTRWRNLFTLTNSLFFEDGNFCYCQSREEYMEVAQRFKEFVDKVLELHQISPIKKFTLLFQDIYDDSDLIKWVSYPLRKGVQELHYELDDLFKSWSGCFVVCETLVNLKLIGLWHCKIEVPLSAWFPNLRILHLGRIESIYYDSSVRLFSSCKLVQELTLEYCRCDSGGHDIALHTRILKVLTVIGCSFKRGTFEIDAPNLTYLKYTSNIGVRIVPSWKNSCSTYGDLDADKADSSIYDHELLNAVAYKATRLRLGIHVIELFFKLDEDEHIPDFRSSSSVQADKCPLHTWEYVTSLIDKSTQFETLVFETCFFGCSDCVEDANLPGGCCYCEFWSPSDIPLPPFSCSVQEIEVHNFCGVDPYSFLVMEHLLANASHLKRLIVHIRCVDYFDDDDEDDVVEEEDDDLERDLEISKRLLMLPRASVDCQLEIEFCSGNTTVISRPN